MRVKFLVQKAVPTHIISGFLGAGKTTLLQYLLQQKPENEVWAVLMNEFGQIGVDQVLLPQQAGYAVQELLGGCLCCTTQLPMQIALARLLSETKPDRLFIEPTGLGHPAQLLEQLTEPHWQKNLDMRALVIVVDGSRLHDPNWVHQNLYQNQLKAAQIVVISHADMMSQKDHDVLVALQQEYQPYVSHWFKTSHGKLVLSEIDLAYQGLKRQIQPLLMQQRTPSATSNEKIHQLPYHYVETSQGYIVAGWKLPKRWLFDFEQLLDCLCVQQDWLRIKGVFHTTKGWQAFNFNPEQLNYKSVDEGIDNRIEIITQTERDWLQFEQDLLQCRVENTVS